MKIVHVRSHANSDGIIELNVPTGMPDTDLEVTVVLEPASPQLVPNLLDAERWKEFISETAGSISDPSFVRHSQGEYEKRSELS